MLGRFGCHPMFVNLADLLVGLPAPKLFSL